MSTSVTTVTKSKQVLTRDWRDIDPKVKAAFGVLLLTAVVSVPAYFLGSLTLHGLLEALLPLAAGVVAAYVTTSSHRDLLTGVAARVDEVAHELEPIVAEAAPQAASAVTVAVDAVDAINAALAESTGLPAPVAAPVQ